MGIRFNPSLNLFKQSIAIVLMMLVFVSPAMAGLTISPTDGIVMTDADGIVITSGDGILMTGADSFLNFNTNGIMMTGADGILMTGADSIAYPHTFRSTHADGILMTGADGMVLTGEDGIVITGADGTSYWADSVTVTLPNGILMTGADGIVMTGADGVREAVGDGILMTGADGVVMTGADGILMTGADTVRATGVDGAIFSVVPDGLRFTGVTGIVLTGADGIELTGAEGILMTGADGLVNGALAVPTTGLQSVDPELALLLNRLTDDSNVNAAIVYHQLPSDSDITDLQSLGVLGGTRFHQLPVIALTATRRQLLAISRLPAVRSIYGNRTFSLTSEPEVRAVTGVTRTSTDAELTSANRGLPVTGKNVTVAVLDTGIDSTHGDLAGRVSKNIKLASTLGVGLGFNYPLNSETLANTDQLMGHGTFVAGVIAGNGRYSGGKFAGVAPGARLVGLSAGDLSLFFVLEGFDYLLTNGRNLGVGVVNCSFSANTVFDTNDPVNVATKMLTEAGINVVFSAGNTGPGAHTLNPYAAAPWVVSVGATDTQGRLASFSSRGDFGHPLLHPTLVAPGVSVVSVRSFGVANVTGAVGIVGADLQRLSLTEIPFYTTANGTSFSAPQVAGAIALMLEVNPGLTPAQVKEILQRTATPLPPYYAYEVGAGMLNVHAAVLEAEFPSRRFGTWRGTVDRNQVEFANDPPIQFSGTVQSGGSVETTVSIPEGTVAASVQISWGPLGILNDLSLKVSDQSGIARGQSDTRNSLGLNGQKESVSLVTPAAGSYEITVESKWRALPTQQRFYGVVEVTRASYPNLNDTNSLSPALQADVRQGFRSLTMWANGSRFGADVAVSRSELADTLVRSARVPQYLPRESSYQDVRDATTMLFVESAQASPTGALFIDAGNGQFRPFEKVTRLAAAVALVRAAGLRSEAEAKTGLPLGYLDGLTIPFALRGYVSVAVSKGLLQAGTVFQPQGTFTRGDLARATAVIQRRAIAE